MQVQWLDVLPATGSIGVIYTIKPGHVSYTWNGVKFVMFESRVPATPAYNNRFRDVTGARDARVLTATA